MRKTAVISASVVAGAALAVGFVASCGSNSGTPGSGSGFPDATVGDAHGGNRDGGPVLGRDTGMGTGSCGDGCDGGVCLGSPPACCAVKNACGSACCAGSSVCLFNACVVPGATCRSASDCPAGQYCDPALGSGSTDAGGTDPFDASPDGSALVRGVACSPPPPLGRCLPVPPSCPGDAGPPDGATCVEQCQYHPPFGKLDAVAKWSWGPTAKAFPNYTDVWSTPTVARMYDTNCDGKLDVSDSPSIVFVSGDIGATDCAATADGCKHGVLRMLNGTTGEEIWSLSKATPKSMGFDGNSLALGDIDGDGKIDIVAITGEGNIVVLNGNGVVQRMSASGPTGAADAAGFAWGGGLAIADLDLDGYPEIIYGASVFSTKNNAITLSWTGTGGAGGGAIEQLSTAADLDNAPDGHLEVLAGNTAYNFDGTILWRDDGKDGAPSLPDGFSGIGDLNGDGKPEAVLVSGGEVWVLDAATGAIELGPFTMAGPGSGGPPTIADFNGDGRPEIGIAKATFYSVVSPDYDAGVLKQLWAAPSHDLSSSVTGSTVFDFSGSGKASVIYGDECFMWVFDGQDGGVQFVAPHMSFTGTEASIVADVDGDGHSEIVVVSNGVSPTGWKCIVDGGVPTVVNGQTWVPGPAPNKSYRGITVYGDSANSWVGTRTLWNQHTYHVSNICDDLDKACAPPDTYGSIPTDETSNWTIPWLNNFRQNVQGAGIFDAPQAFAGLTLDCTTPVVAHVAVRNIGQSGLPAGVQVGVYAAPSGTQVGMTATTIPLLPSQTQSLSVTLSGTATTTGSYYAKILINPTHPTFHECRPADVESAPATPTCVSGTPK